MDARKARARGAGILGAQAGVAQPVERRLPNVTEACAGGSAEGRETRIVERNPGNRANRSELSETRVCSGLSAGMVAGVERAYTGREVDAIRSADFVERFLARVTEADANGCRLYRGAVNGKGYGMVAGNLRAHRVMHALAHGWTPPVVMHRCDVPACCEPSHLVAGTHAENMADMVRKGRQARGTRHYRAKLSPDTISEARKLRDAGAAYRVIAERFGVDHKTIWNALAGNTWQAAA